MIVDTNKNEEETSLLEKRRYLRKNLTPEEAVLWKHLKSKQIENYKWRKQHPVGAYILDFYCPKANLCIELDGRNHYSFQGAKEDEIRTLFLNRKGIKVLRFENKLIWNNLEQVLTIIKQELNNPQRKNKEF